MTINGNVKKKWNIKGLDVTARIETLLGWFWECEDFFMFTPITPDPKDGSFKTIVYPEAKDVKDMIKLRYGYDLKYTLGSVEVVF